MMGAIGTKQFIIGACCAIIGISSACKTTEPSSDTSKQKEEVRFVLQPNRPDWKEQIDEGKIGFYDSAAQTLIGLTAPPHTKGAEGIVPDVKMSVPCVEYLKEHGGQVVELEFLVSRDGSISQFYPLKSAGVCDKDVAQAIKSSVMLPALNDGHPKPALVHFHIELKAEDKS